VAHSAGWIHIEEDLAGLPDPDRWPFLFGRTDIPNICSFIKESRDVVTAYLTAAALSSSVEAVRVEAWAEGAVLAVCRL